MSAVGRHCCSFAVFLVMGGEANGAAIDWPRNPQAYAVASKFVLHSAKCCILLNVPCSTVLVQCDYEIRNSKQ